MLLLAASGFDPSSVLKDFQKPGPGRNGLDLLFAAVGVIVLLFLIWAVFIRKRKDERARRYSYGSSTRSSGAGSCEGSDSSVKSGKRRRRRRRHRLNPTLAETGGLPPPRTDLPSEDPP